MALRVNMGTLADVPPGKILEKKIMARRVAVVNENGNLFGIESDCKHMRASLAKGKITDGIVTCPWHGWKYDLKTGNCLTVDKFQLKKYEIEIEDDQIFLLLP